MTYELDLDKVEMRHHAEYLGERSFRSKEPYEHTRRDTHTKRTDSTSWATEVLGRYRAVKRSLRRRGPQD